MFSSPSHPLSYLSTNCDNFAIGEYGFNKPNIIHTLYCSSMMYDKLCILPRRPNLDIKYVFFLVKVKNCFVILKYRTQC